MTGQIASRRDKTQSLLAVARKRIDESRTMVAWSIARLVTTIPGLQPENEDVLLNLLDCPCDLDVLIFFCRHPNALLTVDDLAARVGYNVHEVGTSIEVLIGAGLLGCSGTAAERRPSEAILYRLMPGRWDAILGPLSWLASSADGRRSLRRALTDNKRRQSLKPASLRCRSTGSSDRIDGCPGSRRN
jgi:hypothetical protein